MEEVEIPSIKLLKGETLAKSSLEFVEATYNSPDNSARITVNASENLLHNPSSEFDPRLLAEIFPEEKQEGSYLLGITAIHGNEPYLMTTGVGMEINKILQEHGISPSPIVLPAIYGERTARILSEDFPAYKDLIYLSDELGAILKKTEFGRAGYQAHLASVASRQPEVTQELLEFLAKPFRASSLNGNVKEFEPEGLKLEINAGANVTSSTSPEESRTHFIFPVLLSEMIEATQTDPDISKFFNPHILDTVHDYAQKFESTYRTTQIPYIHTLSFQDDHDAKGKILTPPFKKPQNAPDVPTDHTRDSVYVMISGSEVGREAVEYAAQNVENAGNNIIAPSWLNLSFGTAALPDVVSHPQVKAVMGRMGWGIGWVSQVAEKPFIAIPHLWFDNPEIHFNIKTLEKTGMGMVYEARSDLIQKALSLVPNIKDVNERMRKDLDIPEDMDGLRFAANTILKNMLERRTA